MAGERVDGFIFYASYYDGISELTEDEQGRLYIAIMDYVFRAKEPELSGASSMAFKFIRPTLDANIKRRLAGKKGAAYGARGGRPKESKELGETPTITPSLTPNKTPMVTPSQTPSLTPKDNINIKDNIKDKDNNNNSKSKDVKKARDEEYLQFIMNTYNAVCFDMPRALRLTDDRRKHLKARLKEFSEKEIGEVFERAQASDFLTGREKNGKGFRASFDWIIESTAHMQKILEGTYDNALPRDPAQTVARQFIESAGPEAARNFEASMNGGRS